MRTAVRDMNIALESAVNSARVIDLVGVFMQEEAQISPHWIRH